MATSHCSVGVAVDAVLVMVAEVTASRDPTRSLLFCGNIEIITRTALWARLLFVLPSAAVSVIFSWLVLANYNSEREYALFLHAPVSSISSWKLTGRIFRGLHFFSKRIDEFLSETAIVYATDNVVVHISYMHLHRNSWIILCCISSRGVQYTTSSHRRASSFSLCRFNPPQLGALSRQPLLLRSRSIAGTMLVSLSHDSRTDVCYRLAYVASSENRSERSVVRDWKRAREGEAMERRGRREMEREREKEGKQSPRGRFQSRSLFCLCHVSSHWSPSNWTKDRPTITRSYGSSWCINLETRYIVSI